MNWVEAFIAGVENFVTIHPVITIMIAGAYITFVGQLDSPTKDSPLWYKEVFAILNFFSLQFKRMYPKVENSPNFLDGVAKAVANGTASGTTPGSSTTNGGTK